MTYRPAVAITASFVCGILAGMGISGAFRPSLPASSTGSRSVGTTLASPQISAFKISGSVIDVARSTWQLRDVNGSAKDFSDLSGEVIFINLWATWCKPCVEEMPAIQALYDSLKSERVVFVIVSTESRETLRSFAEEHALSLPIYQSVGPLPMEFSFGIWPTTVILNQTGSVVLVEAGSAQWNDQSVIDLLRRLSLRPTG